jgi:hypothetical protein
MNHRGAVLGVAMDSDDRGLAVGDGRMRQQREEIAHQALAQLGPPVKQQRQILDELAGVGVGDDGQRRRPRGRLRRQPLPAAGLSVPAHVGLGGDAEPCRARRAALPPRAPELLNGQENIWQFMRQNSSSSRGSLADGGLVVFSHTAPPAGSGRIAERVRRVFLGGSPELRD